MYEFPKTKKLALRDVNEIQKYFDDLKGKREKMIKLLENNGWKIEFDNPEVEIMCLTGKDMNAILCRATKEVEDDKKIVIEKKAECADDDVFVELLGETLSLAKVFSAINESDK